MEAQIFSLVWLTLPGCAPNRLPVIVRWKMSPTKINKKRFRAFRYTFNLKINAQACCAEGTVKKVKKNRSPKFDLIYLLSHNEI